MRPCAFVCLFFILPFRMWIACSKSCKQISKWMERVVRTERTSWWNRKWSLSVESLVLICNNIRHIPYSFNLNSLNVNRHTHINSAHSNEQPMKADLVMFTFALIKYLVMWKLMLLQMKYSFSKNTFSVEHIVGNAWPSN